MKNPISAAHQVSRWLLGAEFVSFMLPALGASSLLFFLFAVFFVPIGLLTIPMEPSVLRALFMLSIIPSGFCVMGGILVTAAMTYRYIIEGRPSFVGCPRGHWFMMWSAPAIVASWWLVVWIGRFISNSDFLYYIALALSPGLMVIVPAAHVSVAKLIADRRIDQGRV